MTALFSLRCPKCVTLTPRQFRLLLGDHFGCAAQAFQERRVSRLSVFPCHCRQLRYFFAAFTILKHEVC